MKPNKKITVFIYYPEDEETEENVCLANAIKYFDVMPRKDDIIWDGDMEIPFIVKDVNYSFSTKSDGCPELEIWFTLHFM